MGSCNIVIWRCGLELEVGGVFHVLRDIAIFGAEAGWSEFIADLEALSAGMQGNGQPIVGADNINYSATMLLGCANLDVECFVHGQGADGSDVYSWGCIAVL